MLSLENFEKASEIVKKVTTPTKLMYSEFFSQTSGAKVYLKPENMQYTGAYKVRGAYYKISKLSNEERQKGLITASAGNHAQGVAYAAKKYGCKATIVMPTVTPLIKVNRTKSYGAEVILHGDVYDDSCSYAISLAEKKGLTFVHPFDDLEVACGQGSIAMEIVKELPTVDYIIVPIGGGGLCTGVATLAKMLNPSIQIIGVEPKEAASMSAALKAGEPVTLDTANTIADGTAVKRVGENIFPYARKSLDRVVTVEDDDLIGSFLDVVENHKMIVENSGLLSVTALKQLDLKGKKVVCVLSGGNMDVITMSSVVQHGLIQRDRIFSVSVLLPDKPGELVRVAATIANAKGNVIKLDHNQFVSTNRNASVELRITIEAFGTEHKDEIMNALSMEGFKPREIGAKLY
ncbi:MAG: threonine ammonia-lyase [Suipraeoptans sp.]